MIVTAKENGATYLWKILPAPLQKKKKKKIGAQVGNAKGFVWAIVHVDARFGASDTEHWYKQKSFSLKKQISSRDKSAFQVENY